MCGISPFLLQRRWVWIGKLVHFPQICILHTCTKANGDGAIQGPAVSKGRAQLSALARGARCTTLPAIPCLTPTRDAQGGLCECGAAKRKASPTQTSAKPSLPKSQFISLWNTVIESSYLWNCSESWTRKAKLGKFLQQGWCQRKRWTEATS